MTRDEQTKLFREMEKDYAARREENRHKPAGQDHGKQPLPSAGEIAQEPTTNRPEQGQGHGKEHGRGM
jgi:hypothetical protein